MIKVYRKCNFDGPTSNVTEMWTKLHDEYNVEFSKSLIEKKLKKVRKE